MANLEYTPAPTIEEFIKDYIPGELFYSFIVGPYGCLSEDSLVLTELGAIPISHIDRPMRVLSWNEKTSRFQLSLSSGAYPKGKDYLYRVTTPEGVFDASAEHRLLCADGKYRRVEELHPGDVLASCSRTQPQTTEEFFQSMSLLDAPYYSQTVEDSLASYAESARRYGQPFLQQEDIGPNVSPAPNDVREFGVCSCPVKGGLEDALSGRTHTRTQLGILDGLQRKSRFWPQLAIRGVIGVGRVLVKFYAHSAELILAGLQSLRNFGCRQQGQLLGVSFLRTGGYGASSSPSLSVSNRPILSIERLGVKQAFWDMHVHETSNYVTADGAIHHNSAKTTGMLFKIVHMAKLQRQSPIDGVRRTRVVVVRNTAPQLADTTLKSWNMWFKDGVAGDWKATTKTFMLRFDDVECEVLFRALDTVDDVSKVLSLEVTFAVLDEFVNIKTEIREGLSGRCGRYPPKIEGGPTNFGMWGASNPGEEDTDWHKFLIEEKPSNVSYFHQPSGLLPNAENLENLPPGYYENLAKGKSPSWVKQFIEAEWGYSIAGKPVIPTFHRDLHVAKTNLIPNPHSVLAIGYDPGMNSAFIFGQMDMYGRLLVLDELVLEGYGAQRACTDRLIPLLNSKYRGFEVVIAPDPACQSRTQTNESSVLDVLKEQRFKKYWSVKVGPTNLIAPRLAAIEGYTTRLTEKGPALIIDPRCRAIIKALASGWRYEKTKGGAEKESPEKNLSSHPGDGLTYLAQYFSEAGTRRAKTSSPQRVVQRYGNTYNIR